MPKILLTVPSPVLQSPVLQHSPVLQQLLALVIFLSYIATLLALGLRFIINTWYFSNQVLFYFVVLKNEVIFD